MIKSINHCRGMGHEDRPLYRGDQVAAPALLCANSAVGNVSIPPDRAVCASLWPRSGKGRIRRLDSALANGRNRRSGVIGRAGR
jgi:hypothetical protein